MRAETLCQSESWVPTNVELHGAFGTVCREKARVCARVFGAANDVLCGFFGAFQKQGRGVVSDLRQFAQCICLEALRARHVVVKSQLQRDAHFFFSIFSFHVLLP